MSAEHPLTSPTAPLAPPTTTQPADGASSKRAERKAAKAAAKADKAANKANPPPVSAVPRQPRTTRAVIRRVDPWTVLKVSLLFYLAMFVVLLTAGVLLWTAARSAGVVDNVESFMDSIGFTDFRFLPNRILRASFLGGLVMVVAGTAGNVLMTVLYNLISDVVGGLTLTLTDDDKGRKKI